MVRYRETDEPAEAQNGRNRSNDLRTNGQPFAVAELLQRQHEKHRPVDESDEHDLVEPLSWPDSSGQPGNGGDSDEAEQECQLDKDPQRVYPRERAGFVFL